MRRRHAPALRPLNAAVAEALYGEDAPRFAARLSFRGASASGVPLTLAIALASTAVGAETFTVTTTEAEGEGSLSAAIVAANALAGADEIVFAANVTGAIGLSANALPPITQSLTISGPGAGTLAIDGNDLVRPFLFSAAGADFVLADLTVRNGRGDGGGAVRVTAGNLVVRDSVFSGNTSTGWGGALYLTGSGSHAVRTSRFVGNEAFTSGGAIELFHTTALIEDSVVSGNVAAVNGGGLYQSHSALTIRRSTISGNTLSEVTAEAAGGGIFVAGAGLDTALLLENSTVAGNAVMSAQGYAGGLGVGPAAAGAVVISHSTIAGNTAASGGGVAGLGPVTLRHTVVADNAAGGAPDIGTTVSGDYNLVQDTAGGTLIPGTGNLTGVDAQLGPLVDNGGPGLTRLPMPDSPLVDAGDPAFAAPPATDQRGGVRLSGSRIDIGALERTPADPAEAPLFRNGFE